MNDEDVEFYWSLSRILERLNSLPSGLQPFFNNTHTLSLAACIYRTHIEFTFFMYFSRKVQKDSFGRTTFVIDWPSRSEDRPSCCPALAGYRHAELVSASISLIYIDP